MRRIVSGNSPRRAARWRNSPRPSISRCSGPRWTRPSAPATAARAARQHTTNGVSFPSRLTREILTRLRDEEVQQSQAAQGWNAAVGYRRPKLRLQSRSTAAMESSIAARPPTRRRMTGRCKGRSSLRASEGGMGLVIGTIGLARASAAVTLANMAYTMCGVRKHRFTGPGSSASWVWRPDAGRAPHDAAGCRRNRRSGAPRLRARQGMDPNPAQPVGRRPRPLKRSMQTPHTMRRWS